MIILSFDFAMCALRLMGRLTRPSKPQETIYGLSNS